VLDDNPLYCSSWLQFRICRTVGVVYMDHTFISTCTVSLAADLLLEKSTTG
jgi:hypothetical protein